VRRAIIVLALAAAGLTVAACGSSDDEPAASSAETARSQVCDARNDIQQQIDELSTSGLTVAGVTSGLDAVKEDLGTIKDAQGELDDERKKQVRDATKSFEGELRSVAEDVASGFSLSGAKDELRTAVQKLADGYRSAFSRVDCG